MNREKIEEQKIEARKFKCADGLSAFVTATKFRSNSKKQILGYQFFRTGSINIGDIVVNSDNTISTIISYC